MRTKLKNSKVLRILLLLCFLIIITVIALVALNNGHYFSSHNIRTIRREITSYGNLAPVIVIILIVLSTVIPPLPIPVPIVEIASGIVFGFLPGFVIVWLAQLISSIFAFYITRTFRPRFLNKLLESKTWNAYRNYLEKKGSLAVFTIRLTMAAPFNIVSFLAGLTRMKFSKFFYATALGIITEALLYTFIGSKLRAFRGGLGTIVLIIVGIGLAGFVFTLFMTHRMRVQEANQK